MLEHIGQQRLAFAIHVIHVAEIQNTPAAVDGG